MHQRSPSAVERLRRARALEDAGILSASRRKRGRVSWRVSRPWFKDYRSGDAASSSASTDGDVPVTVRRTSRLGPRQQEGVVIPCHFTPAASVRPGMVMFTADGGLRHRRDRSSGLRSTDPSLILTSRARTTSLPNGLVTHNSIYALPRRRHQKHSGFRGRLPGRRGHQARAELSLDADDPLRRERADREQPLAEAQGALDRLRPGRPGHGPRARGRARRGPL